MVLTEDPNACALCGKAVGGYVGGVPVYFCAACYSDFHDGIIEKPKTTANLWLAALMNIEKARRKRRNRLLKDNILPKFISLEKLEVV